MFKLIVPILFLIPALSQAGTCRVDMGVDGVSPGCTEYSASAELMASLQQACEANPYGEWFSSNDCPNSSYGCEIAQGEISTTVWYDNAFDRSDVKTACAAGGGKFRNK